MKIMKVLLTIIALNLLLVDFAAVSADYKLRQFRDNALGCVYDTLHRIFAQ